MSGDKKKSFQEENSAIALFARMTSIIWLVLIVALICLNSWSAVTTTLSIVKSSAVESVQKDMVYRQWATQHGGVYAPVTPETPPNPFLEDIPERDIVTPSGRKLTLINPAYMTRQVHALGEKQYGLRGHLTSLNPIRLENKPDEWERQALLSFERGVPEVSELSSTSERTYYRFMRPFITEQGCLKCHAAQGYKEGDIRGGISVSVPWEPVRADLIRHLAIICGAYACIGFIGLFGIRAGRNQSMRRLSERRLAQDSMRLKNDELLSLHRMASHDLKGPLVTIMTFMDFVEEDIAAGDAGRLETSLQHMRVAADAIHKLVDELLWLSRSELDTGFTVETSLQEIVRDALERVADSIERSNVHVQVTDTPVMLYGKPQHLVRVFENLIDNALKFMGDQPDPRIEIGFEAAHNSMYVFVRDNGMGIDSLQGNKIFEVFSKVDSAREGSGIGLALVKRIVEMHGGSVWVESEGLGRGTCFRFTLPVKGKE